MHRAALIAAGALALGLTTTEGMAQDVGTTRAMSFGIAAGATIPTGDAADFFGTGFNITGMLGVQPAALPVGLRFEAAYHNLGGEEIDDDGFGTIELDDLRVISGTANVVLTVANQAGIRPYLIGGVGIYNLDAGDVADSETKFGLNGGGGLEFPLAGFATFLEARFHSVFTEDSNTNLIPIVFGIRF